MFTQYIDFFEDHISAPRGRCTLIFLRALENDQVLSVYTSLGMGVPQQFFFQREGQNCFEIQRMGCNNFGGRGHNPTKLCHMTCHKTGLETCVQLLRGSTP